MKSLCQEMNNDVAFPEFTGERIYMQPIHIGGKLRSGINIKRWHLLIKNTLDSIGLKSGTVYLTIDEKIVNEGETHRRGGRHIDGNYHAINGLSWRASPWSSNSSHLSTYYAKTGGLVLASSYSACAGWAGDFDGIPGRGGDCENIDVSNLAYFKLKANKLYFGNSTFIHESIPLDRSVKRQLFRITLPSDINFF